MHIYVSRALKTALVTGGLFAAGATAAHAEVGGTGLDLNAEASVEVVDALGRVVARLHTGPLPAGETAWAAPRSR